MTAAGTLLNMWFLASQQADLFVNKAECVSALRNSRQLARARQWLRFCTDNATSADITSPHVCLAPGDCRALRARATSRYTFAVRLWCDLHFVDVLVAHSHCCCCCCCCVLPVRRTYNGYLVRRVNCMNVHLREVVCSRLSALILPSAM